MNRRESIGCAAALLSAGVALSAGAALQEKCQRLVDEAVASGEQGGARWR